MATCFIRSFALPKLFLINSKTSTLKFFSSFSPIYNKISGSNCFSHQYKNKNLNDPKQVQFRYFSMNGFITYYDLISNSDEAKAVRDIIIQIHDTTGLPWWGTIISAALTMKIFISLPCGVYQQYILSKLELTKSELNATVGSIKNRVLLEAKKKKWTPQKINSELSTEIRKQWKILIVKNNCHPFKNFILFITQFPFWLMMTLSIRKFAVDAAAMRMENPVAELQFLVGGPIWCPNLAVPDPTYILPAINAIAILSMTEINLLHAKVKTGNKKQNYFLTKVLPNFLRLLAVLFFLVSSVSASGVSLFWASSSLIALMQNLLLLSPRIRRLLRIPTNPTDLRKPYSQIWVAFLEKWPKLFSRK